MSDDKSNEEMRSPSDQEDGREEGEEGSEGEATDEPTKEEKQRHYGYWGVIDLRLDVVTEKPSNNQPGRRDGESPPWWHKTFKTLIDRNLPFLQRGRLLFN